MHSDETIDLHDPFWALRAGDDRKIHTGGGGGGHEADSAMDVDSGGGGGIDMDVGFEDLAGGREQEDHLADNVMGFLDDFLALGGGDADGEIAEEDLKWLEHVDPADFPLPPAASATVAAAPTDAARDDGAEMVALSFSRTVEPWPVVTGAEGVDAASISASASVSVPVVAAATACPPRTAEVGPAQLRSPDTSGMVVRAGPEVLPAVGISPCPGTFHDKSKGGSCSGGDGSCRGSLMSGKELLRRQKVQRYLEKKARRRWSKASSYESRQRVANARPRHKGRFVPLESDFVPVAELRRRQMAALREKKEKAAAQATGAGARAGDSTALSLEFSQRAAV